MVIKFWIKLQYPVCLKKVSTYLLLAILPTFKCISNRYQFFFFYCFFNVAINKNLFPIENIDVIEVFPDDLSKTCHRDSNCQLGNQCLGDIDTQCMYYN